MMESIPLFQVCAWPGCERTTIFNRGMCARCDQRARRAGLLENFTAHPKICQWCGVQYADGTKAGRAYCSSACQLMNSEQRKAARRLLKLGSRSCTECGATIPVEYRADSTKCSVACQQAAWYTSHAEMVGKRQMEWKRTHRDAVRDSGHRRRAKARGNEAEWIDAVLLWHRDEGLCWICSRPVDPNLTYPDMMSKSIDHVIPIARGGGHVWTNVAIAHLRCNVAKSAKVLDFLPSSLKQSEQVV
jgi:hypothetical protein